LYREQGGALSRLFVVHDALLYLFFSAVGPALGCVWLVWLCLVFRWVPPRRVLRSVISSLILEWDLPLSDCMVLYRSPSSHLCQTALYNVISISAIPDHLRAELLQAPVLLSSAAASLAASRCIDMRDFGNTTCSRSLSESTTRH
jgi:hypothetical protein